MNYAKVFGAALQLFPKKINVTVINEITGARIGIYKIALSQLPETFHKPTILEVEGQAWRVVKASPEKADDFSISKKLTIHILEKPHWTDERLQFNVPTRHAYHPLMTHVPLFNDFVLDIGEDDWRQLEFFPASALAYVQEEMNHIQSMLMTALPGSLLWGYDNLYQRQQTAAFPVGISLTDFCQTVQAQKLGAVRMHGNAFVQNAVAIESSNYIYYGVTAGDDLITICLSAYDCIEDEFMHVVTKYNFVLADWCNAKVVMIDTSAGVMYTNESIDQLGI